MMKKIIIILFIIIVLLSVAARHWERNCWDVCFSLGEAKWTIGTFPHEYSIEILYKENVE